MKKNIREEILIKARDLFQERGYNSVSMRDIAAALEISVGNLTYHYKKKEDLIEAVIVEQHSTYRKAQPSTTMTELIAYFQKISSFRASHTYYFRHYTQLAQVCPKVYDIQLKVMRDMREVLGKSLDNLAGTGVVQPLMPEMKESVVQTLMIVCLHGVEYFERLHAEDPAGDIVKALLNVIMGVVTEAGREEMKVIFEKRNKLYFG